MGNINKYARFTSIILLLSTYPLRSQNSNFTSASGNINVTISNAGTGYEIARYASDWKPLDSKVTNSSGTASWTGIPATTYNFEGYDAREKSIWGSSAFLGSVQKAVTDGSTIAATIPRTEPIINQVTITNKNHPGVDFFPGDIVKVDVVVKNPATYSKSLKCATIIDQDKSSSWDYSETHGPLTANANGGLSYFGFEFTLPANSDNKTYYIACSALTEINSTYSYTDSKGWNWNVPVKSTKGSIDVTVRDKAENLVGSDAYVVIYDSNYQPYPDANSNTKQIVNGVTSWSGLPAGTYNFEAYKKQSMWESTVQSNIYPNCFWVSSAKSIVANQTATLTLIQKEPHIETVSFLINKPTYLPGQTVHVDFRVRNNSSQQRNVKSKIRIDGDKTAPWSNESDFHTALISAGGYADFGFDWDIPQNIVAGQYFVTAKVIYLDGSKEVLTDISGWDKIFEINSARTISFSGIQWDVRTAEGSPPGGGSNYWSSNNQSVWIDGEGNTHLKIRKIGDYWTSAEITSLNNFGYGDYIFQTSSNFDNFDKKVVAGMFLYQDGTKELDIEITKSWSLQSSNNGWFVVQPSNDDSRMNFSLNLQGDNTTHRIVWKKEGVNFESYHGHIDAPDRIQNQNNLIKYYPYAGIKNPVPDKLKLIVNLWIDGKTNNKPDNGQEVELIIKKISMFTTDVKVVNENLPKRYQLFQNYPNPFNPSTKILFSTPHQTKVTIDIYSLLGQLVERITDKEYSAGDHTIDFDGSSLAAGIYFVALRTNDYQKTIKIMLLK